MFVVTFFTLVVSLGVSHGIVAKANGVLAPSDRGTSPMTSAIPSDVNLSDSPTTTELASVVETLVAQQAEAQQERERLRQENEQLREELSEVRDENDELRDELGDVRELLDSTRREQAEIRSDVHEVKQTVESHDDGEIEPAGDGSSPSGPKDMTTEDGEDGHTDSPQSPRTALGDCVTLPQPVQEAELSANVRRSAEIAAGAIDYCRSVPAGYAITSSELRTVLTALKDDDGRTYTATVGRVIEHLDELGDSAVTVTETMGGERTVVFSDEFVKRTVAWRQSDRNGVVTGETVEG